MSTLKTTNLQHPSAASPAIVLDADGDATYAGVHDFSAATVTGAPQGLTHINTTTFSAVGSLNIDDLFSADYNNYRIFISAITSGSQSLRLFLRASGTTDTTNYSTQVLSADSTAVNAVRYSNNPFVMLTDTVRESDTALDLVRPFLTNRTSYIANSFNSVGQSVVAFLYGQHNVASSYDGITLSPTGGTMTGSIIIYGYSNGV
jgi:hypothetical protein